MIPKFLKSQKHLKVGPTSLRRHESWGNPRTNFLFLRLFRSAWARYLEAIIDSVGAHSPQEIDKSSKSTSSIGEREKQMAFYHFLVSTSRGNPRHGSNIKAKVLAATTTGMTGLNSK